VAPLDGVVAPSVAGDDRPHVLILTPLSTGAEELAMWLIRGLADSMSISVVLVEGCGERKRLVRAMAGLTPMVYPVADFLHPSVWASAARDLVSARGVTSVLRIGGAGRIAVEIEDGPPVFDLPLDPSEVGSDQGTVLAIGESIAEAARRAGSEVVPLAGAPSLPSIPPDPEAAATVRSGLGISIDQRLVVGIADLEAEQRPEDVVAVAQRLRHREDIHFLLVGDGELAGTVSDIARHYGLENFTLAPRTHGVFELVLAADVVVIAAERDPWSTPAVAALALGRHLVATDVPARRELVDGWDEDRVALVRPGDVSGLAGAVETAIDRRRKPRATKKAWKAAAAGSVRGLGRVAELFLAVGAGAKGEG
jgi:glycosyltransferase involved in cell wall biosynthesis